MLETLEAFKTLFDNHKKALAKFNSPDANIVPKNICNNSALLIDSLIALFKKDKSQYLPRQIVDTINTKLNNTQSSLQAIKGQPSEDATHYLQALTELDNLYAACMQYGLITFGFTGKEAARFLESIKTGLNQVDGEILLLNQQTQEKQLKLDGEYQKLTDELQESIETYKKKGEEKWGKFVEDTEAIAKEIRAEAEGKRVSIQAEEKSILDLAKDIGKHRDTVEAVVADCNNAKQAVTELKQTAESELENVINVKTEVGQELAKAEADYATINTHLTNATESAKNAHAQEDATAQCLANVKQRQKEIDEFYAEIEEHKEEMLEIQKKADANYSQLNEKCSATVEEYTTSSQDIVEQNKEYQAEIKILLQKAVSAGLFGVFKQRQKSLVLGRWAWAVLVIVSGLAVAASIYLLASDLAKIKDVGFNMAFLVRTGIMIPMLYLLYFTTAQYKKERQAEEEYAFKSAISFSLEPYHDLLKKMREDEDVEVSFVKKLMEDIFDNPVKRLYNHKDDKTDLDETIGIVKTVTKDMPNDRKKVLLEAIKNVLTDYIGKL